MLGFKLSHVGKRGRWGSIIVPVPLTYIPILWVYRLIENLKEYTTANCVPISCGTLQTRLYKTQGHNFPIRILCIELNICEWVYLANLLHPQSIECLRIEEIMVLVISTSALTNSDHLNLARNITWLNQLYQELITFYRLHICLYLTSFARL